ncbi:MAG: CHAD domain-containing protein [Bacteroidota bacterium]
MKKLTFELKHNIKEEFYRLICAQTDFIIECIEDEEMDLNEKIHEVRKSLKKIRAVLRLYRDSTGYSTYHRKNIFYRDLGRKISAPRDKHVLLELGKKVLEEAPENIRDQNTERMIAALEKQRDDSLTEVKKSKELEAIKVEVQNAIQDENMAVKNEGFNAIKGGVKRMYKQSRNYMKSILKEPDDTTIHDFRKRVKYLRYQMSVLRPIYPEMITAYRRILKNVSDEIGLYRDYTLFYDMLKNTDFFNLNDKQRNFINNYIEREKDEALIRALEPSKKFFLVKPKSFVKRLFNYYKIKTSTQNT